MRLSNTLHPKEVTETVAAGSERSAVADVADVAYSLILISFLKKGGEDNREGRGETARMRYIRYIRYESRPTRVLKVADLESTPATDNANPLRSK